MLVLITLRTLPRLQSLTIRTYDDFIDIGNSYQLVFNISVLKYFSISIDDKHLPVIFSIDTNQQQQSPVEYLNIDHSLVEKYGTNAVFYTVEFRPFSCRISS